jgi:hypothetical protein
MKNGLIVQIVLILSVNIAGAATYLVGAGRQYQTLQVVASFLNPGDTVLVDGDQSYPGGVSFRRPGTPQNRIVIKGIPINGNRPVIAGGTDGVHFRTDAPYTGPGADHYTFESLEVTGATNRGIFHQSKDLILRDVVVHDCMHGILGADQGSGSCLLGYSEVYSCGSGQTYHQVYMATDEVHNPGSVFRMQFCYLHDGIGGNNVKSRAERNELYYNWIEGAYYHELELVGPDGGDGGNPRLMREDSDIVGNVFWKKTRPAGDTEFFNVTRIGGDGTGETHGRYRFVNNTFLTGSRAAFRMFDSLESVEMHNNVFYRIDGAGVQIMRTVEARWTTGAAVIAGQNNWLQTGSTQIPVQWTGNLSGNDPGFVDLVGNNVRPAAGSPLLNAGTSSPASPPGFPFPSPHFPPVYHPPQRILIPPGTGEPRTNAGAIDLGAYELIALPHVGGTAAGPRCLRLEQNYPNPFNPRTTIVYNVGSRASIELKVFDVLGREVATLVKDDAPPGEHTVTWDATGMPGGVYYYRLVAGTSLVTRAMVVLR